MSELPDVHSELYDDKLEKKWSAFLDVRDEILKALEEARKEKVIGNSLGAAVHIYPNKETLSLLSQLDQLDQLFIVSAVKLHSPDSQAPEGAYQTQAGAIQVAVAQGEKCERCWIVTPEVGQSKEYPTLCKRCSDVISAHYKE
jgi:isoleucyl-tRNA synthetase